ncbi:UNVERIFIED_CONTAM: hypothetical protein FKN15_011032 [Acipenser sinensis]
MAPHCARSSGAPSAPPPPAAPPGTAGTATPPARHAGSPGAPGRAPHWGWRNYRADNSHTVPVPQVLRQPLLLPQLRLAQRAQPRPLHGMLGAQIGLLVLSKVMDSNPEPFRPHYKELLKLFGSTLEDHGNANAMFYSVQTLSAMAAFLGAEELNLTRTLIPKLMVAIKHLIQTNQVQASEAMEVFDELMENEMPIIVPHVSEFVRFCLEIAANAALDDGVRVKSLSCLRFLIRLKGKAILKQKLLPPILQVIDMLALHLPAEKLFNQLTPMTEAALRSENPYHRKAGLMCLAVLAEGCADHIRQKKGGHVTKAYYALENFVENLGDKIEPYLPTLMERMLTSLTCAESIRIKELSVSAIGAIANAAKGALLPYFQPVIDNLKGYLVNTCEEVRSLQIQSLGKGHTHTSLPVSVCGFCVQK